jgi:hypothetical protein
VKVPLWLYIASVVTSAGLALVLISTRGNEAPPPPSVPGTSQMIDMPAGYPDVAVRCYGEDQIFVTITNKGGTALWVQPYDTDCMKPQ